MAPKALVVTNCAFYRTLVKSSLDSLGFEGSVYAKRDEIDVIDVLINGTFECLVFDFDKDVEGSHNVAWAVRNEPQLSPLKLVWILNSGVDEPRVDATFVKPFAIGAFKEAIGRLIKLT